MSAERNIDHAINLDAFPVVMIRAIHRGDYKGVSAVAYLILETLRMAAPGNGPDAESIDRVMKEIGDAMTVLFAADGAVLSGQQISGLLDSVIGASGGDAS